MRQRSLSKPPARDRADNHPAKLPSARSAPNAHTPEAGAGRAGIWCVLLVLAWPLQSGADRPAARWRLQPVGLEFDLTLNEVRRRCPDLRRLTADPNRRRREPQRGQVTWLSLRCGRQMGSPYLALSFVVDEAGRTALGGMQMKDRRGAGILRDAKRGMNRYEGEPAAGPVGQNTVITRGHRELGTLPWFVFGELTEVRAGPSGAASLSSVAPWWRRMDDL